MHDSCAQWIGDVGAALVFGVREHTTFGPITITLRGPDRAPIDLTEMELIAGVRRRASDAEYLLPFELEVLDPPSRGCVRLELTSENVAQIVAAMNPKRTAAQVRAFFDLRAMDALGYTRALLYGELNVVLGAAPLAVTPVAAASASGMGVEVVQPHGVVVELRVAQGLAGPPGPPGEGTVDPDALPIAPPRAITPGDTTPIVEPYSFAWSTISNGFVLFDGERWLRVAGGAVVDPPSALALVDENGAVLVDDDGKVIIDG